jgi:hypothetical protein
MKPKYRKPTALPLGESAKGSGQCNAGSGLPTPGEGGVPTPAGSSNQCVIGTSTQYCLGGGTTVYECSQGNVDYWSCSYGLTVTI